MPSKCKDVTRKSGFSKFLRSGRKEEADRVDALSPVLYEHSNISPKSPIMSTNFLLFVYNDFLCVHSYCLLSVLTFLYLLASLDVEVVFVMSTSGV